MKKTLFFTTLLAVSSYCQAQTGTLRISNQTPDPVVITMHAYSPTGSGMSATGCDDIRSNSFTIPAYTIYRWTDPGDFESGTSYCLSGTCGTLSPIGWNWTPSPWSTTIVDAGSWGAYPPDFQWTYVTFDFLSGCTPVYAGSIGDVGISCSAVSSSSGGCTPYYGSFNFGTPSGALGDIAINFVP